MRTVKNGALLILYTILLGGIVGAIIWAFLRLMNIGINFVWDYIPGRFNIPFYTIIVCVFGALLIGLWRKKFGDYPEELRVVLGIVKKTGGYKYNNIFIILISALLPLLFGASVGPEAGIAGVIAGLCTWISDKIKKYIHKVDELNMIGISATLGTIFKSPMFGFVEPLEDEKKLTIPKNVKVVLYLLAAIASFGSYILLGRVLGKGPGVYSLEFEKIKLIDLAYIIPLVLIGIVGGFLYVASHKLASIISNKYKKYTVIKAVIGGIILGVLGTVLPLTMFSGEHQIADVAKNGSEIGIAMLIVVAMVKIVLTTICVEAGLKGGHFFPIIFAGICLGYAFGMIFGISVVFAMAVVTTALVGYTLKKPIATVLLLMIV
ncbi:MAG: chloride channel protein, partial [Eubacterium sp.]|nr:chloride channel protein [Eubacterium sp.]